MKKYDLSGIPLEDLREAVAHQPEYCCFGINCSYCIDEDCDRVSRDEAMRLLREELESREKPKEEKKGMTRDELKKYDGKEVIVNTVTRRCPVDQKGLVKIDDTGLLLCTNNSALSGGHDPKAVGTGYKYCWYFSASNVASIKLSNDMPTLEAGMIVTVDYTTLGRNTYLMIGKSWGVNIDSKYHTTNIGDDPNGPVVEVSKVTKPCLFGAIKDNLELIWAKAPEKTADELKIEELEKTIETAMEQVKELRGEA